MALPTLALEGIGSVEQCPPCHDPSCSAHAWRPQVDYLEAVQVRQKQVTEGIAQVSDSNHRLAVANQLT